MNLHLLVDGPRHDVARSQRQPLVILLHERLAVRQFQHAAVAAHRLGDQIRRVRLLRVVQYRRVELHELHVLHRRLRAVGHRDAVARGDDGVRRRQIHRAAAARAQHRHLGQIRVHLLLRVQHVGPVAADVRRPSGHPHTQVVLRDNLHREVMLLHLNVRTCPDRLHQPALNLGARVVGVVQNAELRVAALAVQVERAVLLAVEVHAPFNQFPNLLRRHAHHLLHCRAVRDVVAGNHRVLDVLVEVVHLQVRHTRHAALRERRVRLVQRRLANHTNLAFLGASHLQRVTHASHARADNQEIVLVYHWFFMLNDAKVQNNS